ncbi:MAG TPA: hypothetical protein VF702_06895 [Allosphingosinicella sp.]|jgi:hypothetical protein
MNIRSLALLLLAAGCTGQSVLPPAAQAPRGAAALVAEMKAACGGAAWDRVQGWHETGTVDLPGRPGVPYEIWHDMRTLKTRMENRVAGRLVRQFGYYGTGYWQIAGGEAEFGSDAARLRRYRRDAYLSSSGWYFPARFPAAMEIAGTRIVDGKPHDVLRISPDDADSFELWVDRTTHRVRRIVAGSEYADLSDYRTFPSGVCSATTGRQGDGDPAHDIVLHVQTIETDAPIPAAVFVPPPHTVPVGQN